MFVINISLKIWRDCPEFIRSLIVGGRNERVNRTSIGKSRLTLLSSLTPCLYQAGPVNPGTAAYTPEEFFLGISIYLWLKHDKDFNQSEKVKRRLEARDGFPKVRTPYVPDPTFQPAAFFLRGRVESRNHISDHYGEHWRKTPSRFPELLQMVVLGEGDEPHWPGTCSHILKFNSLAPNLSDRLLVQTAVLSLVTYFSPATWTWILLIHQCRSVFCIQWPSLRHASP